MIFCDMNQGLSATMDVRIVYFEIMRPFAESVLGGYVDLQFVVDVFI